MPRVVMTMNGDHQLAATAPLDLTTSARRRTNAGSKDQDCALCVGDARVTSGSPSPPASTGTGSADSQSRSAPRKRPTDSPTSKLPLRKRPIPAEPKSEEPPPAPAVNPDRTSPTELTNLPSRESGLGKSRVGVAPITPKLPDRLSWCILPPVNCVHPVYYLPPVPEPPYPPTYPPEDLLARLSLATHQDEDGDTALHIAVVQGNYAIVSKLIQLLLCARRGLDIYNNLRQTPLHLAVITKQPNIVDALLGSGADPAALDRHGQTALHLCCEYDQRDCLSALLSRASSSPCLEVRNFEGLTPLHMAVQQGHQDLAKMLLDAGADINAMDIKSGQSPLVHAVESNNAGMVHFLIENRCDVNRQSYSGNTALHVACGRGQVDIVRVLLKSGADSSLKNYHNDTPVMVAKNKKIIDVLRGRGTKQIRDCMSVLTHGSTCMENGSPSSNHSRGSSPSTTPHSFHPNHSPRTSSSQFSFY
ncbi:B-cell lymphoma 3 protein [Oryzias melastigma]|uniref:B-cell lymphoma 3 protein n=1 Tax=Oryzias melastigma TaxID=30732 RepID=A0A3B3CCW5_ORYME|nr:B-cell lymphoma 3 protein homolog [Oryzias melastigma]KAF6716581.1 B-cell lymphoma 3 protein [Oryzias melastigma]